MELAQAECIAKELLKELGPFCKRVETAGSIRRGRPMVRDIDIVLVPRNQGQLAVKLLQLGMTGGSKLARVTYRGAPVDIYLASPEEFPMLLLVRTGSAAFNKSLAMRAKAKGLHFAADGRGILRDGARLAWRSEEEILEALGLSYIPPERRERL